jgi:hypothetical protein
VILGGCASNGPAKAASRGLDTAAPVAEPNVQLQRSRIHDWSAPDDHTVIVTADNGTRYRAETLGPCIGLNFATTVAFEGRGGFDQVDRFSSVVLRDGTRCAFKSFDRLKAPEGKALDSYEQAPEKE